MSKISVRSGQRSGGSADDQRPFSRAWPLLTGPLPMLTGALPILTVALIVCFSSAGCVNLAANLIYAIKGRDLPAEFTELEGKRVAVVVSTAGGINSDATGVLMSRQVHALLKDKVKKITMVKPEEVDQVVMDQPSGPPNMTRLGGQLDADYLVAIDLKNFNLREGKTLYRGSSECSVMVYKIGEGDRPVLHKEFPFVYPETGVPVTEMNEAKFRTMYLTMLSDRAARTFYPYDPTNDVAIDAAAYGLDRF